MKRFNLFNQQYQSTTSKYFNPQTGNRDNKLLDDDVERNLLYFDAQKYLNIPVEECKKKNLDEITLISAMINKIREREVKENYETQYVATFNAVARIISGKEDKK